MNEVVIIRGVPGSGKSTHAKTYFSGHVLVEADDYFMSGEEYFFNPKYLKDAHERCFRITQEAFNTGRNVVVANTFSRIWEMQKYLDAFPVNKVIRMMGEFPNEHGVPDHVVEGMKARFEPYPMEIYINVGK